MKDCLKTQRQLERLSRKEQKFLHPEDSLLDLKFAAVKEKISTKVPDKAVMLLQKGFEKAFSAVLHSGTPLISKAVSPQKRMEKYARGRAIALNRRGIKVGAPCGPAQLGVLGNQAIGAAEGAVLGILGVGLPDIPMLIGLLLKTVYEAAADFGFDYLSEGEQIFILQVFCAAFADGEDAAVYAAAADRTAFQLDRGKQATETAAIWTEQASRLLAGRLMLAKAVQGIPVVGIAGGLANWPAIGRVGKLAAIKYHKRYLYKILDTLS